MSVIHVLSVNDIRPHDDSVDCACFPTVEAVSGNAVVVHNSYDRREDFEPGRFGK